MKRVKCLNYLFLLVHCYQLIQTIGLERFNSPDIRNLNIENVARERMVKSAKTKREERKFNKGEIGSWQPLKNQPTFVSKNIGDPSQPPGIGGAHAQMLLTDGTIIVQNIGGDYATGEMWKLTPDEFGDYVKGTWSQLASLPDGCSPLYYAGAVLADGRYIIMGGEYDGFNYDVAFSNKGAIYDPVANIWTVVPPPSFFVNSNHAPFFTPNAIGDAASVVLEDGTFMLQDPLSRKAALLDLKTLTWTETGTATKSDRNDEEGWTLLPNGNVLTVDCYTDFYSPIKYPTDPTNSEIYNPQTQTWKSAGSTKVTLTDPVLYETGPAVLRPDGTVFAVGSGNQGNTAIYDYKTNIWTVGPKLPISDLGYQITLQDGPSVLLPNGNVLIAGSGGPISAATSYYSAAPIYFFEFDGKELIPQPAMPNSIKDQSYMINLLLLPSGQVMLTDFSLDVEIYTPGCGHYKRKWAPVVTCAPEEVKAGKTYEIKGIRFNGMSQDGGFGDDYQPSTNYPLVRITNKKTKHVKYCRTHDHSFMGVASDKKVYTHFDVPNDIEQGDSVLEVVANGIPSKPIYIRVKSQYY